MTARTLLLTLLLLTPTITQAGVYRWVDEQGNTHFGDQPPAKVVHQEVNVKVAPAHTDTSAVERRQKIQSFLEQKQQARNTEQAAAAKAEKQAAKHEAQCRKLQARLKHMDSISTFYNLNDQGERVFVSESENEQIRQRFRAKVQKTCKS